MEFILIHDSYRFSVLGCIAERNEPLLPSGEQFSQVAQDDHVGTGGGNFPHHMNVSVVVPIETTEGPSPLYAPLWRFQMSFFFVFCFLSCGVFMKLVFCG